MEWLHKILGLILVRPFFCLFFKLKVSGQENLEGISRPLLVVSNHKYFIDSFAFGAAIPFSADLYPVRVMGAVDFFYSPVLEFFKKIGVVKFVYWVFGVFPAIHGKGLEEALKTPKRIIEDGGLVFLHPEGRVIKGDEIGQFKRGASALALMTNVKILPVAFKRGFKRNGKYSKDYFVKFGKVFTLPKEIAMPEQGAEYMRKIIVDLYQSIKFAKK